MNEVEKTLALLKKRKQLLRNLSTTLEPKKPYVLARIEGIDSTLRKTNDKLFSNE